MIVTKDKIRISREIIAQETCDGIVCKDGCPLASDCNECSSNINETVIKDILWWLRKEEERIRIITLIIVDKGNCKQASAFCAFCDCPLNDGDGCNGSDNTRYKYAIKYLINALGEQETKELLTEELI